MIQLRWKNKFDFRLPRFAVLATICRRSQSRHRLSNGVNIYFMYPFLSYVRQAKRVIRHLQPPRSFLRLSWFKSETSGDWCHVHWIVKNDDCHGFNGLRFLTFIKLVFQPRWIVVINTSKEARLRLGRFLLRSATFSAGPNSYWWTPAN